MYWTFLNFRSPKEQHLQTNRKGHPAEAKVERDGNEERNFEQKR